MSTETHEASHIACALMVGRRVDHVLVHPGHVWAGEELGNARVPVAEEIETSQIPICVIGYMSEGEPRSWPPAWPACLTEPRESLGLVLRCLGADRRTYEQSVEIARDMLSDPEFLTLRDAIARALHRVPRLEAEDISALANIYKKQEQTCDTPKPSRRR